VYQKLAAVEIPLRADGLSGKLASLFFRDKKRSAPHNAYNNLLETQAQMPEIPMKRHFVFSENAELAAGTQALAFSVGYNNNKIKNSYEYNEETDSYLRTVNKAKMVDATTKDQVMVQNVIVQYADHPYFPTKEKHVDIQMIGKGKAVFFIAGKTEEGTWERAEGAERTVYKDKLGNEIELRSGKTWVHIADDNTVITVS